MKNGYLIALVLSGILGIVCSIFLGYTAWFTIGPNIYNPEYYESPGPFSYQLNDWLADLGWFYFVAFPWLLGLTVVTFLMNWLTLRKSQKDRHRAFMRASKITAYVLLGVGCSISTGAVLAYSEAAGEIDRLNKYGPPR